MNFFRTFAAGVCAAVLISGVSCTKTTGGAASKKQRKAVAAIEPLGTNTVKGTFTAKENSAGMVTLVIDVSGLSPGKHGTHIHTGASCGDNGKAAGPHWDPHATSHHGHPKDPSTLHHAADMPNIEVDAGGLGTMRFQTTNFKLSDLAGKTIIVHENLDNYTDSPVNGGSGARIGCGVIRIEE